MVCLPEATAALATTIATVARSGSSVERVRLTPELVNISGSVLSVAEIDGQKNREGIAGHATPGGNISGCSGIVGGHQQGLPRGERAHGKHEFHDELPTALFAQVEHLISEERMTHGHSGLS